MSDLIWFVAHTRPRCEKKLAHYCAQEGMAVTLPCYRTVHKYRGKTAVFQKPLFPGYLFLEIIPTQRQTVYQSKYVANLLDVPDQPVFVQQLGDILRALETDLEDLPRALVRNGAQCVDLFRFEDQALFAENVFSGQQCVARHRKVLE